MSASLRWSAHLGRERREEQAHGTADEAEDLQPDAANPVGEQHGEHDADDQQNVDQCRALGGHDIVRDHVAEAADVIGLVADGDRQDDRREDADAIGAQVLDEPWHRGEDGGAPVAAAEQRQEGSLRPMLRARGGGGAAKLDCFRILRTAGEQACDRFLCRVMLAVDRQPVGAFDYEKAPDRHDECRDQRRSRTSSARHSSCGWSTEHDAADAGAGERAECLEAKRSQHELAAIEAGDVLRDDHVRCRIVAAERKPEAEQANRYRNEVVAQDQHGQECDEDEHLRDEHALAAEIVGEPAKQRRADQDAGEAGGADDALFRRAGGGTRAPSAATRRRS